MEPGLTAGWLADEIWARLEILKLAVDRNIQFPLYLAEVLHFFSNFGAFIMLFPCKHFYKVVL